MGAEYLNTHSFNMTVCCPAAAYVYVFWNTAIKKNAFGYAVYKPIDPKAMPKSIALACIQFFRFCRVWGLGVFPLLPLMQMWMATIYVYVEKIKYCGGEANIFSHPIMACSAIMIEILAEVAPFQALPPPSPARYIERYVIRSNMKIGNGWFFEDRHCTACNIIRDMSHGKQRHTSNSTGWSDTYFLF